MGTPLLEILAPREQPLQTARDSVHVLGRTQPGAAVRVGGQLVPVFATGVFARDSIPLPPGASTLLVEATTADGQRSEITLQFDRIAPPSGPLWPVDTLWLNGASLRPAELQRVAPGEPVDVAVQATPGQIVQARLPGQAWAALPESADAPGQYRAALPFSAAADTPPLPLQVRIGRAGAADASRPRGRHAATRALTALTPGEVGLWRADTERLWVVGPEGAELQHGVHAVRLGGPYLTELPSGTVLQASGQRSEHLRVQLAPDTTAWVDIASVTPAPAGTAAPRVAFTSVSLAGAPEGDVLSIPLSAPVPYAVRAVADAGSAMHLEVEVFNAHHATTWITHRGSPRVVREVTVEQAGPGRVLLRALLRPANPAKPPRLWGWRVERRAGSLQITLRAAPVVADAARPLAGLRVALEPGHGGPTNLGAVGATGVPEKDINRWTADALRDELLAAGAEVVMVREGDDNPSPRERAQRVVGSDAQLFVSMHANATDTSRGYLRVAGTSCYYKHTTGRDAAAAVHRRMLSTTGLDDFGLVGNFNYTPIRLVTWMPAILVEQAFMSHPGDEARMLDAAFRQLTARAVRLGLEDFLRGL